MQMIENVLIILIYAIIPLLRGNYFMTSSHSPNKSKRTNGLRPRNLLKFILIVIFLGFFLGAGTATGFVAALVKDEPVRSAEEIRKQVFKNTETGFAYFSNQDKNGTFELIGAFRNDEDRRFVKFEEISPNVKNAFLAVEDRAFYDHHGVNFKAFTRAVLQQIFQSDVQTGGSTITQQLAKNTFFSLEKSYQRKAKEIFLALRMERVMPKDDIFTAYLNKIPFGKAANLNNVYGIQAAAKGYFNKNASELNLAEAAYLAGIPQRPTAYSAFNSKGFDEEGYNLAKKRQELVLKSMLEEKFISQQEYEEALRFDIKAAFDTSTKKAYSKYPYLILEVENQAAEKFVEAQGITPDAKEYSEALENAKQEILSGGYKVYTTVDRKIYEAMNNVAKDPKNFPNPISYNFSLGDGKTKHLENEDIQIGATLIHNKTGAILGFIGGRDYNVSAVNHSNFRGTTKRQPGSSIKPLLDYGPALELGKVQPATPIDDIPLGGKWEPDNWNSKYNGRITARHALNQSFNIPAIKVYKMVGPENGYEFLSKLGFQLNKKRFLEAGLTPAIGTIESSPEVMASAYSTFANGGTHLDSYMIERIVDRDGNVVYEHKAKPEVVFSEQTSYLITDMLRTVIKDGTAKTILRYIGSRDVAGKTGTTNDTKDLWFVGYTPEITLSVWTGYDYPTTIRSGNIAKTSWGKIITEIFKADPELSPANAKFERPGGLIQMQVSSTSGKLPSDLTKEAGYLVTDWFNKKFIPTEIDDSLEKARVVEFNGKRYLAKDETPDDMVDTGIFFKREPYVIPPGKPKPLDVDKELPTESDPRESAGQPAPPSSPSITTQGNKNTISWEKNLSNSVVGYRIYRASASDLGFTKVGVVKQTDLKAGRYSFTDQGANNGPFAYYITTVDVANNESNPSAIVGNTSLPIGLDEPQDQGNQDGTSNEPPAATIPKRPKGVSGERSASGLQVTLTWAANPAEDQVLNYNVYFSDVEGGKYQLIGTTEGTTFVHPSVPLGDAYYRVTATNENGESEPSKVVKIPVKNQ